MNASNPTSQQSATEPPEDLFCDLVMKGGITSGVVYPAAIERLSHHYRFKNIGGTSAGAIAAAITAAAEYQRRNSGSRAGFDALKSLPDELKQEVSPGQRKLKSLFQPQPETRRLFDLISTVLLSSGSGSTTLAVLAGAIKAYWQAVLAASLLTLAAFSSSGLLAAVLTLIMASAVFIAWMLLKDIAGAVVSNGFGLCTGLTESPNHEALTPWLNRLIQHAAGREITDAPLTFGDLWDAPGHPPELVRQTEGETRRSINLQMFSTNVTHGRPYVLPLAEPDRSGRFVAEDFLLFSPAELSRYLPAAVLAWMVHHAKPYQPAIHMTDRHPSADEASRLGLLQMPHPRHFPVLLAARMSLSFPLLFAALPLWAIDDRQVGRAPFRRCWFSDGGISSNFPVHLFDTLVPSWPTFAFNLENQEEVPGRLDVYIPHLGSRCSEHWNTFDHEIAGGAGRFLGFFSAIVATMQNWNDTAVSRMIGVRDRVVRVHLKGNEGGLNLNMEAEVIAALAERGERAAQAIIDQFAPEKDTLIPSVGWDDHRFLRLSMLVKLLQSRAPGVLNAMHPDLPHATPLITLIDRAGTDRNEPPPGYENILSPEEQRLMKIVIDALRSLLVKTDGEPVDLRFQEMPRTLELQVRPTH